MSSIPYRVVETKLPTLGLIVLKADETIEQDFRRLFSPHAVQLHITRVTSGDTLSVESIGEMEKQLTAAASLLPSAAKFDALAYACTSGTAQIGEARVKDLVSKGAKAVQVTNPLTAALAATKALGIRNIGIVSPYVEDVGAGLARAFEERGLSVGATLSFGEETEARVARIDPASIADAARTLATDNKPEGVFLSCTNLKTLDIIDSLESALGVPVLSSNQVLAWHMAKLAGVACENAPGKLFDI